MSERRNAAMRLQQDGQWEAACQIYRVLLEESPSDIELLDHCAVVHAQAGRLAESAKLLAQGLQYAPHHPRLHNHYGSVLRAQGHMESAIQHYREALRLQPNYAAAYNNLGALYYRQGRLSEAIACLERSIRIDPQSIDAQYNLANSYVQRDTPLQAIPHYQTVLRLSPDHLGAHHNLGILLATLSHFREAKEHLLRALAADTPRLDAHFHYAMALSAEGEIALAAEYYEKVLAQAPTHAHAHHNLAVLCLMLKDTNRAEKHFTHALTLNPHNTTAMHFMHALRGDTTTHAPEGYIRDLFDFYAPHYNAHLTGPLQYQVPHQLRTLMGAFVPYEKEPWLGIDLGCGTGLCAPYFQDLVGKLIGIDLSENMIAIARQSGGYHQLHVGDIVSQLNAHYIQAAELLIAADVLVYYGDVEKLFEACSMALKPHGYLTFSTEDMTEDQDYALRASGRYAHHPSYIQRIAAKNQFHILRHIHAPLRQQDNMTLMGSLWVLQKAVMP